MWGSIGDGIEILVDVSLDQWLSTWATWGLRQVSEGHRIMTKNLGVTATSEWDTKTSRHE